MAGSVAIERKSTDAPPLAIGGRFGKFGPEEEKASSKADVKENEQIKQLKNAWRSCKLYMDRTYEDRYFSMLSSIKNLRYSAKDVENFSLVLIDFQDEENFSLKAGLFLSALINNGEESYYNIHTQHLKTQLECLGYMNTKNIMINGDAGCSVGRGMKGGSITVKGNVGEMAGLSMKGGNITVKGNAGNKVGQFMKSGSVTINGNVWHDIGHCMYDGSIIVKGNAGDRVGHGMTDGSITVEGNVKNYVGHFMRGGEIHIQGDLEGISYAFQRGKIFHKGKLIVDK
jgi:hypothetical protein